MTIKKVGSLLSIPVLAMLTLGVFVSASNKPEPDDDQAAAVQGNPNRPRAEMLPVMLRAGGFVPRELSRPAGEYVLSINDQSGAPELVLRLERDNGERAHEARVSRRKPYWRQLLRLTPGTYLISEASHPEWTCRITVTPN